MNFVSSEQQHADILTKDLSVAPFNAHAELLMNSSACIILMEFCSIFGSDDDKTFPKSCRRNIC